MDNSTSLWSGVIFNVATQQPGESFNDFLVALHELAKTCNYCSDQCSQKNIWDQIIEGTPDGDTIEQLLKQSDLTLEAAITICRAQEAAKKQCREMCDNTPGAILAVRQQRRQPPTTHINQYPATDCAPDALSRNPVTDPQTGNALAEYDNQNNQSFHN